MGYSRNQDTGPFVSAYELYIGGLARSVLPLDKNTRQDDNTYRLNAEFDFLGFRLTLSHQWEYFKDDTGLAVLSPDGSYPVPNPSVATSFSRGEPMHIRTPGWFGNLATTHRLWAMNARMTYSKGDQNFIYSESATGNSAVKSPICSNCGIGPLATVSTNMSGAARRPFSAGDFSFSLFPVKKPDHHQQHLGAEHEERRDRKAVAGEQLPGDEEYFLSQPLWFRPGFRTRSTSTIA